MKLLIVGLLIMLIMLVMLCACDITGGHYDSDGHYHGSDKESHPDRDYMVAIILIALAYYTHKQMHRKIVIA